MDGCEMEQWKQSDVCRSYGVEFLQTNYRRERMIKSHTFTCTQCGNKVIYTLVAGCTL